MSQGFSQQGLSLRYFAPANHLRHWISSYYLFECAAPLLRDTLRAELPQVRFLCAGAGTFAYKNAAPVTMPAASLSGVSNSAIHFDAIGPVRLFGVGLLPAGWATLIGVDADELSDCVIDLDSVVGPCALETLARMIEADTTGAMVAAADAFFGRLAARGREAPLWLVRTTDQWLASSRNPDVNQLTATANMSARQIERLVLRLYGATPKLLARKYRTLKAAVRLGLAPDLGWEEAAADIFYDQSHFIRDFRTFIGLTPSQFMAPDARRLNRLTIGTRHKVAILPSLTRLS